MLDFSDILKKYFKSQNFEQKWGNSQILCLKEIVEKILRKNEIFSSKSL